MDCHRRSRCGWIEAGSGNGAGCCRPVVVVDTVRLSAPVVDDADLGRCARGGGEGATVVLELSSGAAGSPPLLPGG
ncbi:hypothetical protein Dimus_018615 [Dionaea muscipula]